VDQFRAVDHPIATGLYPDMREHGWPEDAWPDLFGRVLAADVLVIAGPVWLGDNSSETKKVIERLYAHSGELNDKGQWLYYGRVGGSLITGNEDGIKHCASNVLYSLQHIGYSVPPQADAGWIGEAGPGPSYGDELEDGTRVGLGNEFTNRNTTFMTWNVMHLARLLKTAGGFPDHATSAGSGTPVPASTRRTRSTGPDGRRRRSDGPHLGGGGQSRRPRPGRGGDRPQAGPGAPRRPAGRRHPPAAAGLIGPALPDLLPAPPGPAGGTVVLSDPT